MGIVQRQGLQNTVFSYLGILLGYLNQYVLFTQILKLERMGLTVMLLSAAVIFAELAKMSNYVLIFRFFPFFKEKPQQYREFTFATTVLMPLFGIVLFTLLFFLFKPYVIARFAARSPLFVEYYSYFLPIAYGLTFIGTFINFANANLKSVLPTAVQEVGIRLFHTLSVSLFGLGWINFEGFLAMYVAAYFVNFLVLFAYLVWLKRWRIAFSFGLWKTKLMKIMLVYGAFNYFTRSANIIVEQTGVLQVGELMGEKHAAIYQIIYFLSLLVNTPFKAMVSVLNALVAKHFHQKDYKGLGELYHKSSLNSLIAGIFVYICILTNIEDLFRFLHIEAEGAIWIFAVVGMARLIDVANGINYAIVLFSKHYRYTLISSLLLLALTVALNYVLIPRLGAMGAGISSGLALLLFNAFNTLLVYRLFKLQPFDFRHLKVLGIAALVLAVVVLLPLPFHPLLNIFVRGILTTLTFGLLTWYAQVSPDANELWAKLLHRFGLK